MDPRAPLFAAAVAAASLLAVSTASFAAQPQTAPATTRADRTQQFALPEKDPSSPRKSKLASNKPDAQVLRTDVDNDGDPDLLESWWNNKRVRWLDENDDLNPTDVRGDTAGDALQVDIDGDGYYDGPEDMSIKWVDDNRDGRPDAQIFAVNPRLNQRTARGSTSHWMAFIDVDQDGVNGYVNWADFEFHRANWRVPPATSPTIRIPAPNFSPDYMGNTIFLKEHFPAGIFTNPEMNWENPFAFYDPDGDGLTEYTVRLLESPKKTPDSPENDPRYSFAGFVNEAMGGMDLDNDSGKGNEFDLDMSWRFFSKADAPKEKQIDYRRFKNPHDMKAPRWVLDGKYFRFDNWRRIDQFTYVPHDKCFDAMWNTDFESVWIVFDEDDDDHRWERVELQYPSTQPYSTARWRGGYGNRAGAGLGGHPQADSLGDRGEWDDDNSGKGQVYVGRWDRKLHLYGAERGAWPVDRRARYWGSSPVLGNSSPENAPKVEEIVFYTDTDNNGFLDRVEFDYDGDQKIDLAVSLLDYKTAQDPHPDVRELLDPGKLGFKGMHEFFTKRASLSFQESLKIYRAAWKKGLTSAVIDDYAIATSVGERYDHGYWLREEIFRLLDKKFAAANDNPKRDALRRLHFLGDVNGTVAFIDSLDAQSLGALTPTSRPAPAGGK